MISILVEHIARFLADRRLRGVKAMRERKRREREQKEAAKAAYLRYEQEHHDERLRLGRQLLDEAPRFAATPEVQWAVAHFGRWWLAGWGWLYLDHGGRLWKWTEKHWFYVPKDKLMDTPEVIATEFSTGVLRMALAGLRQKRSSFWWVALQEEILHRLGQRGRAI